MFAVVIRRHSVVLVAAGGVGDGGDDSDSANRPSPSGPLRRRRQPIVIKYDEPNAADGTASATSRADEVGRDKHD